MCFLVLVMYPQSSQLLGYIDSQLTQGVAAMQIRNSLLGLGWPLPIVDDSLNQELAHTARILPAPIDLNAYYSYYAPQYYYPGYQPQSPAQTAPIATPATVAWGSSHLILDIAYGLWRFITASLLVLLAIWGPVMLAAGWLLVAALTAGSAGINILGSYIIVCTIGWIVISSVRYLLAPFIAAAYPDVPLWQTLGMSYDRIQAYIHGKGKGDGGAE
jgi:hypothetical protein